MNRILYITCLAVLLFSIFKSGLNYYWDNDELYHSQVSYLISKGYTPFKDFLLISPPTLHYLLMPIFITIGASFNAIIASRIIMIVIFALRVTFSFLLVRKIFGKTASLIFLPTFLIDPLTIFSSMQIRPDNLSLMLLPLGLLLLYKGNASKYPSKKTFIVSGVVFFLSLISSVKSLPTVGIFLLYSLYGFKRLYPLVVGFISGLFIFLAFYLLTGNLAEMITNTIVYPKIVADGIVNQTEYGFLLKPFNDFIYGLSGKPINWIFLWTLPMLGGAGLFSILSRKDNRSAFQIALSVSFILHFFSLFFIKSVFAQYYLPQNWYYAIFASIALARLFENIDKERYKKIASLSFLLVFIFLTYFNVQANLKRSEISYDKRIEALNTKFKQIPSDAYVFPNLIFHPLAYPLPTGVFYGDVPKSILDTYQPLEKSLEEKKVPYLILEDYDFRFFTPLITQYIKSHYYQSVKDPMVWLRYK